VPCPFPGPVVVCTDSRQLRGRPSAHPGTCADGCPGIFTYADRCPGIFGLKHHRARIPAIATHVNASNHITGYRPITPALAPKSPTSSQAPTPSAYGKDTHLFACPRRYKDTHRSTTLRRCATDYEKIPGLARDCQGRMEICRCRHGPFFPAQQPIRSRNVTHKEERFLLVRSTSTLCSRYRRLP